jgi:hypothetical protein
LIGDIIYFVDGRHKFGIEVKFNAIRLTRREFNAWIVGNDPALWPDVYIGVGSNGVTLTSWTEFRNHYCACIREQNPEWVPSEILQGYGPHKSTDKFGAIKGMRGHFPVAKTPAEALERESHFVDALARALAPVG